MWRLTESVSGRRCRRPRPSAVRLPSRHSSRVEGHQESSLSVKHADSCTPGPITPQVCDRPSQRLVSRRRAEDKAGRDASLGPVATARAGGQRVSLSAGFDWRCLLPGWRHGGGHLWPFGQLARRSNLMPFLLVSISPLNDDKGGHLVLGRLHR
jgi:hypothetical protein